MSHANRPTTEPRTEAGRHYYDEWGNDDLLPGILAIEAEAAQQTNIEWNAAEGKVWHYDHEAEAAQGAAPLRPNFCVSCEGQHDEGRHEGAAPLDTCDGTVTTAGCAKCGAYSEGAAPRWADLHRCSHCNEKGTHAPQCDAGYTVSRPSDERGGEPNNG